MPEFVKRLGNVKPCQKTFKPIFAPKEEKKAEVVEEPVEAKKEESKPKKEKVIEEKVVEEDLVARIERENSEKRRKDLYNNRI